MTAALKLKHSHECIQERKTFHEQQKFHEETTNEPDLSYQFFSHFSENLNKCFSLDAIAQCLHGELINIFDFVLLRFSFYRNNSTISYTLTPNACNYKKGSIAELWQQEMFFISKHFSLNDAQAYQINQNTQIQPVNGWNFKFRENSGIIVTIIASEIKTYLPVLEPLVENIYSKLLSLKIVEELTEKNNEQQITGIQLKKNSEAVLQIVKTHNNSIENKLHHLE